MSSSTPPSDPCFLDAVYHAAILAVLAVLPPRVVLRGERLIEEAEPDPHRLAVLKTVELDILVEMLELMFRLWRVREEARQCWEGATVAVANSQPLRKRRKK